MGKYARQTRHFSTLVMVLMCLGVCLPNLAAAQHQNATPIAPDTVAEQHLGTQSVAFATFSQSSTSAAAGDTVSLTLTVTSTATAPVDGAISIPFVAGITFTPTNAERTENMATCAVGANGTGGIAGTYSLAAGTGTCAVSFAAQLAGSATGMLAIGAEIRENGSLASSPGTTIEVTPPGVTASFSSSRYTGAPSTPIHISLIIDMVGPITNGFVDIPMPSEFATTFAGNVAATLRNPDRGTCAAFFTGTSVTGGFAQPAGSVSNTCTIEFDFQSPFTGDGTILGTVLANSAISLIPETSISVKSAVQPSVQFDQPVYALGEGETLTASADIFLDTAGTKDVVIASSSASITNPSIVDNGTTAICTISSSGTSFAVTISQDDAAKPCVVTFAIILNPGIPPGNYPSEIRALSESNTVGSSTLVGSADLNVVADPASGPSMSFDKDPYIVLSGDSVTMTLTVTIPAGLVVTSQHIEVFPPPLFGDATFTAATASFVDTADGSCDASPGTSAIVTVTSTGGATVSCSITMTMTAPPLLMRQPTGNVVAADTSVVDPLFSPVSALVAFTPVRQLSISLSAISAAPGDEVIVTVVQNDTSQTSGSGTINSAFPAGVTLVPGTTSASCMESQGCLVLAPPSVTAGTTVSVGYELSGNTETVPITLQYTVTVNAAQGAVLLFGANGVTTDLVPTLAPVAALLVRGNTPDATDFDLVVEAGGSVSGSLANHVSSENGIATYASDPPTGEGSLTLDASTGAFTYTAGATPGTDTISYTVTDTASLTATGTITVTIIDPLVTADVALHAMPGDTITSDLNGSVSGGQPPHTFTAVSQSLSQGDITIDANGTLTYTANDDATGSDTFTYEVTDGLGVPITDVTSAAVSTGTITITIIQPMVIAPIALTVAPGATITYDLHQAISGGLAPYTFTLLGQPEHGIASIDTTGILTITADADASGSTSFEVQVTDSYGTAVITSAATATGTISLTYAALPTATATATLPSGPPPTATSPSGPPPTATSPSGPTPTATSPGGAVPSPTSSTGLTPPPGDGTGPLPPNPNAPATATATSVPTGNGGENGSDVSQLPSTGMGQPSHSPLLLLVMTMLAFGLSGWSVRRHKSPS